MQNCIIKTEEQTILLDQNLKSLQLLTHYTINQHKKKRLNYICKGLVQSSIKLLFHLDLDIPAIKFTDT